MVEQLGTYCRLAPLSYYDLQGVDSLSENCYCASFKSIGYQRDSIPTAAEANETDTMIQPPNIIHHA